MVRDAGKLKDDLALFERLAAEIETTPGPVTVMVGIPPNGLDEVQALSDSYDELGIERLVCGVRYNTLDEYKLQVEELARRVRA